MDFDVTDPTKGRSTPFTPHGIANPQSCPRFLFFTYVHTYLSTN
jgi:hypothetical protein